jgi:hypothetical protein
MRSGDFEDVFDVEGGAPSRVFDVFARPGAARIVGEGARATMSGFSRMREASSAKLVSRV